MSFFFTNITTCRFRVFLEQRDVFDYSKADTTPTSINVIFLYNFLFKQ